MKERLADREYVRLQRQIRENERIWSGFRRIEIGLIGAQSLGEIVEALATELPETFPGVDVVTLACADPEYELARLVAHTLPAATAEITGAFVPLSRHALASLFPPPWNPRLGAADDSARRALFPALRQPPASVALAPLVLRGELIGSLNQASFDARHFLAGTATDLLEHLAAVTALCVDSAISHERLKVDGLTDALTGVANRRFFERRLAEEVERSRRAAASLACMFVDVDHFKRVNDRYGHQVGDRVLARIAALLGEELRGSDVLARYGGEEFVLLLPATDAARARAIAERLRAQVSAAPIALDGALALPVTVSIGLACRQFGGGDGDGRAAGERLVWIADRALYRAKQEGRNRVVAADENSASSTS